ncbi:hypothetical protein MKZ38_001805 [Zalerion maritima]|uniref:Uncharacterized protein n=1 Tax=Zalerion maritima TaxID=339359 RepID=A0AAD5RFC9_9PEZI|nr:hypothetical protein MKZ38_001805 [Zalerion maritima]
METRPELYNYCAFVLRSLLVDSKLGTLADTFSHDLECLIQNAHLPLDWVSINIALDFAARAIEKHLIAYSHSPSGPSTSGDNKALSLQLHCIPPLRRSPVPPNNNKVGHGSCLRDNEDPADTTSVRAMLEPSPSGFFFVPALVIAVKFWHEDYTLASNLNTVLAHIMGIDKQKFGTMEMLFFVIVLDWNAFVDVSERVQSGAWKRRWESWLMKHKGEREWEQRPERDLNHQTESSVSQDLSGQRVQRRMGTLRPKQNKRDWDELGHDDDYPGIQDIIPNKKKKRKQLVYIQTRARRGHDKRRNTGIESDDELAAGEIKRQRVV